MKILLLALLLLTSCGTRKVQTSDTVENQKEQVNIKVDNDIKKSTDVVTIVTDSSETLVVEPIDTTKVIVIAGVTYKNARLSYVKNKIRTNITSKEIVVDKGSMKIKQEAKVAKQEIKKEVEKKTNPLLLLLIPLVVGLLFIFIEKVL